MTIDLDGMEKRQKLRREHQDFHFDSLQAYSAAETDLISALTELRRLRFERDALRAKTIEEAAKRVERMSNSTLEDDVPPGTVRIEMVMPKEYAAGWHAACKRAAQFIRSLSAPQAQGGE